MNTFSQTVANYIGKLSEQHLILFCILNCEKMLPGYEIFTQIENWGDICVLNTAIEEFYLYLFSPENLSPLEALKTELDANFLDSDEFNSVSTSYAFDTCIAFDELIQFLKTKNKVHAVGNAQACINTVDMFIQQKENITYVKDIQKLEQIIESDQYMINEKKRQLRLLERLSNASLVDKWLIASMKLINESLGALIDVSIIRGK